jgi:MscS family membrane protein
LSDAAPWALASVLGSEVWRWVMLAATLALVLGARRLVMNLLMKGLRRLTGRTDTRIDDQLIEALDPPLAWFVLAFGVYLALLWPNVSDGVQGLVNSGYRLAVIVIVGWALVRSVDILTDILSALAEKTGSELDNYLVPLVGRVLRAVLVGIVIVIALQELGINVTGLVAGLGVGGLAFALAAQDTVANWFGALMIYTDRPFETGDWIKTSSLEGVVEDIGLRSTRVRTFAKTVVSVPNRQLADDTIENFSRMPRRRVNFKLGVTYATTPAMMQEAIERIRDLLREHPDVDQTFWLVKFTEFGDSALTILVHFFTNTTDWERYLSIRQEINLAIMHRFAEIGVEAAFPSTSVYMAEPDADAISAFDAKATALFAARRGSMDIHESQTAPSEDNAEGA